MKRACETCRKGKTKCDGEEKCQVCVRKGVECVYTDEKEAENASEMNSKVSWPSAASTKPPAGNNSSSYDIPGNPARIAIPADSYNILQPGPLPGLFQTQTTEVQPPPLPPPLPPTLKPIDWASLLIQKDDNAGVKIPELEVTLDSSEKDLCIQAYFQHFHHHWALVHRMMAIDSPDYDIVLQAVRMNGAWTTGTEEGQHFAREIHENLMPDLVTRLVRISCLSGIHR